MAARKKDTQTPKKMPIGKRFEPGNSANPDGRNTLFHDEYCGQVYELCLLGASDAEIADNFGVDERTTNRWKEDYPRFCQSMKRGKTVADGNVAAALHRAATGYEYETEKVFQFQGDIVRTKFVEHVGPNANAARLWLMNRRPKQWRDAPSDQGESEAAIAARSAEIDLKLAPKIAFLRKHQRGEESLAATAERLGKQWGINPMTGEVYEETKGDEQESAKEV